MDRKQLKTTSKTVTPNPRSDPVGVYNIWRHTKTDEVLQSRPTAFCRILHLDDSLGRQSIRSSTQRTTLMLP